MNRTLMIVLAIIVFAHVMLATNKTYSFDYYNGEGNIRSAAQLSSDQYYQSLKSMDDWDRMYAIQNTYISYFDSLPGWIINLVYVAYLLFVIYVILMFGRKTNTPSRLTRQEKLITLLFTRNKKRGKPTS